MALAGVAAGVGEPVLRLADGIEDAVRRDLCGGAGRDEQQSPTAAWSSSGHRSAPFNCEQVGDQVRAVFRAQRVFAAAQATFREAGTREARIS